MPIILFSIYFRMQFFIILFALGLNSEEGKHLEIVNRFTFDFFFLIFNPRGSRPLRISCFQFKRV